MCGALRHGVRLACLVWFVALLSVRANAQGLTGTIDGTIHDHSGALMRSVTVMITSPKLISGPQTAFATQGVSFQKSLTRFCQPAERSPYRWPSVM
jgi:hypothetical protein